LLEEIKKIKLLYLVFFIWTIASGCGVIERYHAQGLKNYFLEFLKPQRIQIKEISFKMFSSSRQGYFLFKISPHEFERLREILSLKQINGYEESNGIVSVTPKIMGWIGKIDLIDNFEYRNQSYDLDNMNTWTKSPFLPNVYMYIAEPPLAPMEGNTRSSFVLLLYNSSTEKSCVILEYPYG